MKKILLPACLLTCCGLLCSGYFNVSIAERYRNAEKYAIGDFTYAAASVRKVELRWTSGSVDILCSDAETLSVTESGDTLTDAQKLHWLLDGDTLRIEFCQSGYKGTFPPDAKRLTLEIPVGVELDAKTVSAGLHLSDAALEKAEIQTTSGAVSVCSVTAESIELESVSGTISTAALEAREEIEITTTSGAVAADSLRAPEIELDSVSGRVEAALSACRVADVKTVSGAVRLTLADGLGASVRYRTTSGSFHADGYAASGNDFVFGSGECAVRVKTTSGSLTVE